MGFDDLNCFAAHFQLFCKPGAKSDIAACWNVMLCGTMSCLQDRTLWCEAKLRAEHSACLGRSIGVNLILLWARWWAFGGWSHWFVVWPVNYGLVLVCDKSPPPNQHRSICRRKSSLSPGALVIRGNFEISPFPVKMGGKQPREQQHSTPRC